MHRGMRDVSYCLDFTIEQLPPMNTADGLHWRTRNGIKKQWEVLVWQHILNLRPRFPLRKAFVEITRHSSMEPDYDNLVQGGKFLLDALVINGVIRDDNPAVVGKPHYHWVKASPKKGKVRIVVKQIDQAEDG